MPDRDLLLREPQVTLGDLARLIGDPVNRIDAGGIRGYSANSLRTSSSTASTSQPHELRSYFGGRSDTNAARTVLRAMPNFRAISSIGIFSDRCKRRISARFSTVITLRGAYEGSVFVRHHEVSIHPSSTVAPDCSLPTPL